jgi:ATP/maltotriose-dependent transcriptional regulator MalT
LVVVSARAHQLAVRSPSVATAFVSKRRTIAEIEQTLHDLVAERLDWGTLTKREIEILALVADGMSNRAIAKKLWLSAQTVKYHLTQVYRKLGVSDRLAAVERVRASGLLGEHVNPLMTEDLAATLRTISSTHVDAP